MTLNELSLSELSLSELSLSAAYSAFELALAPFTQTPQHIILGYSGGADSELMAACLALYLQKYSQHQALLVHVNHGLSPHAGAWALHCHKRAQVYKLPCIVEPVQIPNIARSSLEAQARDARYAVLKKHMLSKSLLLTAHHGDDQIESLLLAIKRGSGLQGLSGIHSSYHIQEQQWLLRPFISISRQEIERTMNAFGLIHIEDESNDDTAFDRNFLRYEIVPQLKKRWPGFMKTVMRTTRLCAQEQSVYQALLDEKLSSLLTSDGGLLLKPWQKLDVALQASLLRTYLQKYVQVLPSESQLQQMMHQLCYAREDANLSVTWDVWSIRRYKDKAYVVRLDEQQAVNLYSEGLQESRNFEQMIQQQRLVASPAAAGYGFAKEIIEQPFSIRFDIPGSFKCHPYGRHRSRTFKKLMQEYEIPPWQRSKLACLFSGEKLVSVLGLWVEADFAVDQSGWHISCELSTRSYLKDKS